MARRNRRGFQLEHLEQRCLLAADIVINEINYDPPDKTQRAEYIELFNNSDSTVDLSGWRLADAVEYTVPAGTMLGANSYLVIAEDPATTNTAFGTQAIGPWTGGLRNTGERIVIRDAAGMVVDEVDYGRGFPWPTAGDAPGHSIELINPNLDNDLGGNWRRAGTASSPVLIAQGSQWDYLPGTETPSSPSTAWRARDFDDTGWQSATLPVGYGDDNVVTNLNMRGNYSTIYLRKEFQIVDPGQVPGLVLNAQFDDGINVFINGQSVVRENVTRVNANFDDTANSALENFDYVEFVLPDPADYLVAGTNVIAVQLLNASLGGSSDAWFDAELATGGAFAGNHSAGNVNAAFAVNAPPAARQVRHGDNQVLSGQDVVITTKVTDPDGVESVTLEYQTVAPGDYFGRYLKAANNGTPRLNPRYDDPAEWTVVAMNDSGTDGDLVAGDDVYSATIMSSVQQHRHLVRYRMNVADTLDASIQIPYADDPSPNFAYYVYDGVPDWTGADRPGRTPEVTYPLGELNSIATYHLLTSEADHQDSQHIPDATTGSYSGSEYLWPGTMIYDGEVYDNINYRARGGVWRYAMGKNMWKFDFNRNQRFQAKDDYGEAYDEKWDKLNFSALIQQGNFLHRGEQGLFESVGFKLFNLAGVESPNTHYVHFRVVDTAEETTADQYSGDFQGLYLAIEQPDGNMLDQHDLPDGNLYKIEGHRGDSNNQGPTQVSDGSDVAAFISGYRNSSPSAEWWEANLDLDRYYSYRTIVDAIHHYDIAYGKNYYYYHNPETDKFQVHPWDLDLTWANNMFGSGDHDFRAKVYRNRAFRDDADNRARELLDLLYNPEQTGLLIDEMASHVYTEDQASWVDADRAMWDYNPILNSGYVNGSKAGHGRFYERSATDDFAGMAQLMKDYVEERTTFITNGMRTRGDAPVTPSLTYVGAANYAANGLAFETTAFADPQGDTFGAMEWRIAEITDPSNPQFGQPIKYEINATHESGVMSTFESRWSPQFDEYTEGALYRVRVRMQNQDGNWSHWSAPEQFVAGPPMPTAVADSLRISELHYHPAAPSAAEEAAGFTDQDDFEFIELVNIGSQTINLSKTALRQVDIEGETEGVAFEFAAEQTLAPGGRVLVVEDIDAFRVRYGDDLPIAGQWSGGLGNNAEQIRLVDDGNVIHSFVYEDSWHVSTDGDGYSLEVVDAAADLSVWDSAGGWMPSAMIGGSPGTGPVQEALGDFNGDDQVNATDIDLLFAAIRGNSTGEQYDLNQDEELTFADATFLIESVLNTKSGDLDLNGEVGFADFLQLSSNFGKPSPITPAPGFGWEDGDLNGDREVDFADFLILSANFGLG